MAANAGSTWKVHGSRCLHNLASWLECTPGQQPRQPFDNACRAVHADSELLPSPSVHASETVTPCICVCITPSGCLLPCTQMPAGWVPVQCPLISRLPARRADVPISAVNSANKGVCHHLLIQPWGCLSERLVLQDACASWGLPSAGQRLPAVLWLCGHPPGF